MLSHAKFQKWSFLNSHFPIFPMKLVGYWSHAFWVTISETKLKSFCKSVKEHCREGKKRKNRKTIAKLFALQETATRSWWRVRCLRSESAPQSQHPNKFSSHKSCENRDITFSIYHINSNWSHDHRFMWH